MGNTFKEGKLLFFPHDVSFKNDTKIKLIRSEFGNDGPTIFWDILEKLYADKGYYLEWNEDSALLMAGELGFKQEYVEQIVNRLVSRSLFNDKLFNSVRVLTSKRVQDSYVRACVERTKIRIRKEYNLLEDGDLQKLPPKALSRLVFFENNHEEKAIDFVVNPINPGVNEQSTVEYSKGNDSREDDSIKYSTSEDGAEPVETVDNSADIVDKSNSLNKYVAELTFNKYGNIMLFRESDIIQYQKKYPKVNIVFEIWKMQEWINNELEQGGNFKNLKDKNSFIDKWFFKTQKGGGSDEVSNSEMYSIITHFENHLRHENMKLEVDL